MIINFFGELSVNDLEYFATVAPTRCRFLYTPIFLTSLKAVTRSGHLQWPTQELL